MNYGLSWRWTTAANAAQEFEDAIFRTQMGYGLSNEQANMLRQEVKKEK